MSLGKSCSLSRPVPLSNTPCPAMEPLHSLSRNVSQMICNTDLQKKVFLLVRSWFKCHFLREVFPDYSIQCDYSGALYCITLKTSCLTLTPISCFLPSYLSLFPSSLPLPTSSLPFCPLSFLSLFLPYYPPNRMSVP